MKKLLFLLFLLVFWQKPCFGAENALLAKIQAAYNHINSFEAGFEQQLKQKESGAIEKRKGKIYFQKPLLIRWQTARPHEEILVVNQDEIWDYIPEEEIAYRYSPEIAQDSRSIIQVITGQARLNRDFDVKENGRENGLARLKLYPREPSTQMVEAQIWVDEASGAIMRASVTDFYGNINDIAFNSFKPDAKFANSQFKFKAPKGVEVEDRIGRKIPEKELFR